MDSPLLQRAAAGALGGLWCLGLDALSQAWSTRHLGVEWTAGGLALVAGMVAAGALVGGLLALPLPRIRAAHGVVAGGLALVLGGALLGGLSRSHALVATVLTVAAALPLVRPLPRGLAAGVLALPAAVLAVTLVTWPWSGLGAPPLDRPPPEAPPVTGAPDLLLLTLDTTRADHLGAYGGPATPTLDGLAARGAVFEAALAPMPLTGPSHASMLTGLLPPFHGVGAQGLPLDPAVPVVAETLREAGWHTAAVAGSHVLSRRYGYDRGFAAFDDQVPGVGHLDHVPKPLYNQVILGSLPLRALEAVGGDPWVLLPGARHGRSPARTADQVTAAALAAAEHAPPDRPLFLWAHYWDPHHPYDPPEGEGYVGEVAFVDAEIGRLLDGLDAARSRPRWVFVVGDHGEALGDHDLEGHTGSLYDEVLRVPLLIAGPGAPAGTRVSHRVTTADLGPTLLEVAGRPSPEGAHGRSLVRLLQGRPFHDRVLFAHRPPVPGEASGGMSLREGRWKLIRGPGGVELYDLEADPTERANLAARRPERVEAMTAAARAWRATWPQVAGEVVDAEALRALGYAQ